MSDLDKVIWSCAIGTLLLAMIWGTQAAETHDTNSPTTGGAMPVVTRRTADQQKKA